MDDIYDFSEPRSVGHHWRTCRGRCCKAVTTAVSQYLTLTLALSDAPREGVERWELFCRLAEIRRKLRAHGLGLTDLGLTETGVKAHRRRVRKLLSSILQHFDDDQILVPCDGPWDLQITRCRQKLVRRMSWHASEDRVLRHHQHFPARTVQEDILSQELLALADGCASATLNDVILLARILRARDTATVCWAYIGKMIADIARSRSVDVLSFGSGFGQFEEIVAMQLDARVVACDVVTPPKLVEHGSRIKFHKLNAVPWWNKPLAGKFTLVILKDVLHESPSPNHLLSRSVASLTNGGFLLVIEPMLCCGDERSRLAFEELDSTNYKSNLHTVDEWESMFQSQRCHIVHRMAFPSGVMDNNDSFPRSLWILRCD